MAIRDTRNSRAATATSVKVRDVEQQIGAGECNNIWHIMAARKIKKKRLTTRSMWQEEKEVEGEEEEEEEEEGGRRRDRRKRSRRRRRKRRRGHQPASMKEGTMAAASGALFT